MPRLGLSATETKVFQMIMLERQQVDTLNAYRTFNFPVAYLRGLIKDLDIEFCMQRLYPPCVALRPCRPKIFNHYCLLRCECGSLDMNGTYCTPKLREPETLIKSLTPYLDEFKL